MIRRQKNRNRKIKIIVGIIAIVIIILLLIRLSVYVKPIPAVSVMAHSLRNYLMKWVIGSVKSAMSMGQQQVVLVVLVGLTLLSCAIAVVYQELPTLA